MLSIGKLTDDSTHAIEFNSSQFLVKHKGIVLTSGTQKGGLYYLFVNTVIPHINNVGPSVNNLPSKLWHLRLVHAPHDILKHITSLDISAPCSKDCLVCPTAKQSMLPFPKHSSSHANSPFILVHMDVWGSYKVTTTEGCRYFLTVDDDYSRGTWTFLLSTKEDIFKAFCNHVRAYTLQHYYKVYQD